MTGGHSTQGVILPSDNGTCQPYIESTTIFSDSVTKILRKIRATTFTEKLRKITREGERAG